MGIAHLRTLTDDQLVAILGDPGAKEITKRFARRVLRDRPSREDRLVVRLNVPWAVCVDLVVTKVPFELEARDGPSYAPSEILSARAKPLTLGALLRLLSEDPTLENDLSRTCLDTLRRTMETPK